MFHVIDDNKELCKLTVEILKDYGFNALGFVDAVEYLRLLDGGHIEPPIAIFTDIIMPDLDGHQLIKQVRNKLPKQKIVAISGFDSESNITKQVTCNFVLKPFRPSDLISIAEALVKCDQEGTSSAIMFCQNRVQEDGFVCPIDCFNAIQTKY